VGRNKCRGFTLIELMIVVLIISICVVVGVGSHTEKVKRASVVRILPYAKQTMGCLAGYHMINGEWPHSVPNVVANRTTPVDVTPLIAGRWPQSFGTLKSPHRWVEGTVQSHEGSFLI